MALDSLRGVKEIGGFKVLQKRPLKMLEDKSYVIDWDLFDKLREDSPIYVDHDTNMISFKIQDRPIGEVGINGCQLTTMVDVAILMLEKLDKKFPCDENADTLLHWVVGLEYQANRTKDRKKRGVEGTSQK